MTADGELSRLRAKVRAALKWMKDTADRSTTETTDDTSGPTFIVRRVGEASILVDVVLPTTHHRDATETSDPSSSAAYTFPLEFIPEHLRPKVTTPFVDLMRPKTES